MKPQIDLPYDLYLVSRLQRSYSLKKKLKKISNGHCAEFSSRVWLSGLNFNIKQCSLSKVAPYVMAVALNKAPLLLNNERNNRAPSNSLLS
jgi:hypothetical protein